MGKLGIKADMIVASAPLRVAQAIGVIISEKKIGGISFLKDPLSSHSHSFYIGALTRLCDVYQLPFPTYPSPAVLLMMTLETY